ALIGPSGGGKTTLTNLLLRFVDPADGRLTLSGVPLSAYRVDDVRSLIAVAGQDAHLFSATIRDNITLGGHGTRIVVGRALLGPASILVLDEPTAHLDVVTAEELIRDIFAAAGDRS